MTLSSPTTTEEAFSLLTAAAGVFSRIERLSESDLERLRAQTGRLITACAKLSGGRIVGQKLTVTDSRGVSGPATITEVDDETGGFHVHVDWEHTDESGDKAGSYTWFFTAIDAENGGDYGLKLDFGSNDSTAG